MYTKGGANMNLGRIVQQRRMELGISQEELAIKMGYKSRSSINKIENGRPVTQKIIVRLAEALNTTPAHLMGWDQDEIEAISEQIDDKNGYIDHVELALKALFEEFGRLHLSYEDIQLIKDYSNSVKGNEELYRYMAKARRRFVELQLNEEETEEMIKYAEFLVSKRKKG